MFANVSREVPSGPLDLPRVTTLLERNGVVLMPA
jgi:hypothetical protein